MGLHQIDNPPMEAVKHADLHGMEEVGLWEVSHNTGDMSKHLELSVNMALREFCIGSLGVGIAERFI